jgi:hypothetical protein
MPLQNVDRLTSEGNVATAADMQGPYSNWVQISSGIGATVPSPHTQTGMAATQVAAISMGAFFTGLFEVSVRASFSDGTTAGTVTTSLTAKQGAGAGLVAGGVASAKFGGGAASIAAVCGMAAPQGQVLNVDAAGGGGLTFEGSALSNLSYHTDIVATLTGLLTAQANSTLNFEFFGICDALGVGGLAKTPFPLGKPVCFFLTASNTAAHVITYNSLNFLVRELSVP